MLNIKKNQDMKTRNDIYRQWALLLMLLVGLPLGIKAQTDQFEMVLEKIDGTELTFRITNDYPLLQYQYGGEDGVNTLEIQTASGNTSVPCPDIKRLFTRVAQIIAGDANGDGVMNVTDIVATVNYIMEKPSDGFNKEAADLNGDGLVNVTDIVKMVSIIMAGGSRQDLQEVMSILKSHGFIFKGER